MDVSPDDASFFGRRLSWTVAAALVIVLAWTQLPGLAQRAGDDPLPTVAFVARADNPVDALAASSIAGTLGGVVLLTPSNALSSVTRQALIDLDPDLVVLAGGTAALSTRVEESIQSIPLHTERVAGPTRVHTAAALAALASDIGRPLVTGATVAGDAGMQGTLSVGALEVGSADVVDNLNAALLEGNPAEDFAREDDLRFAYLNGLGSIVGRRGVVAASRDTSTTGVYHVDFDRNVSRCAQVASAHDGAHIVQTLEGPRFSQPDNRVRIRVYNSSGNPVNAGFALVVMC